VLVPRPELRSELIARMKADDISDPFHYVPLHNSPAGQKFARTSGSLVHTDDLSVRGVRLPLFPRMGTMIERVIDRIRVHLDALLYPVVRRLQP
jgi:dTDP-4-amino-4,6-dideoxygalactose transaminase